jgi:hypothetical protein
MFAWDSERNPVLAITRRWAAPDTLLLVVQGASEPRAAGIGCLGIGVLSVVVPLGIFIAGMWLAYRLGGRFRAERGVSDRSAKEAMGLRC